MSLFPNSDQHAHCDDYAAVHPHQHPYLHAYPYTDASGKVARLLANLYLIRGGFLPCVIHSIDRQRYYDSFRMPEAVLRDLMLEAMDNSLTHAEKHFAEAPPSRARRSAR